MNSDDDDLIAIAHYNKSIAKPKIKENNSDDDVPVFSFNKPKLKSLGFASKFASLIKENKPFVEDIPPDDVEPTKAVEPPKVIFSAGASFSSIKTFEPLAVVSNNVSRTVKRERDFESNDANCNNVEPEIIEPGISKKTRIKSPVSAPVPSEPKTYKLIDSDNNFRRLNLKKYKSRGNGNKYGGASNKGSKYKRSSWKQNNIKFAGTAKFGVGVDRDEDTFNYNLIGSDLPTVLAEGEEEEKQIEEEIDPLSAEGKFNALKKNSPIKKSPKKVIKKVTKPKEPKIPKTPKVKAPKAPKSKTPNEPTYELINDTDLDDNIEIKPKSRKKSEKKDSDSDDSNESFNLQLEDSDDQSPTKKRPSRLTKSSAKTLDSSSDEDTVKTISKVNSKKKLDSTSDEDTIESKKTNSKKRLEESSESEPSSESEIEDSEPIKVTKKVSKKRKEPKNEALSVDGFINDEDILSEVKKPAKPKASKEKKVAKPRKNTKKAKEEPVVNDSTDDELLQFIEKAGDLEEPKPLFELNPDGSLPELPQFVYRMLERDFGHKAFRPHQAESILRIACGLSTVVVLSTGYGKSLIYQMAAKLYAKRYPGSVVLVISPLISLMHDQLYNLSKSLKAAVCDSTLSEKSYKQLLVDLNEGKINILYMSPEAIMNKKIRNIPRIAFVCIDEIHCLSQWSHNFRPSYLQLSEILLDHYKVKCVLGLTATATQQTINEIKSYFNIDVANIMLSCKLPNNLLVSCSEDKNKEKALVNLLKSEEFGPYFDHVIVYCSRRELTEKIALLLRTNFESKTKFDLDELAKQGPYKKKGRARPSTAKKDALIAEAYHAGLSPGTRKAIQNRFISGRLRVIVATMAFGMGIDMRNIRSVIHFNMPKSIENYVQEIGRAGRDNQLSRCHLFLETAREDINDVKKYIHGDGYDNLIIKKLTMRIFEHCDQESCKYIKNPDLLNQQYSHHVALPVGSLVEALDIKEETILTLLCYLQSANYIKLMSNCAKTCTLRSYKGSSYFEVMAQENAFMATVMKHKRKVKDFKESAELEVDMIDLCNNLDGDYWILRNHLKQLEWNINEFGKYKSKSGIVAQFTNVSFYIKRRCIPDEDELDKIYEHLWERVSFQVNFCHSNFNALFNILNKNSYRKIEDYIDTIQTEMVKEGEEIDEAELLKPERHMTQKNNSLKEKLNQYFLNELNIYEYEKTSKVNFKENPATYSKIDIDRLINGINQFICTYYDEMKLNGNIIARIFHGIGTPRYPAEVWGRQRNYWRAYLDIDFEKIKEIAREQLIK